MAKTISIINNKGGAGKTATTAVFAEILASLGNRVLLVDLDSQSNLSMIFRRYTEDNDRSIRNIFSKGVQKREDVKSYIVKTDIAGIDIIPADNLHKNTPATLEIMDILSSTSLQRDNPEVKKILNIISTEILHSEFSYNTSNTNIILKRALDTVKNEYDFILIDNAPASNKLTINSMLASDYVLCPAKNEQLSYEGVINTLKNIMEVQNNFMKDDLKFLGIFLVATEPQTKLHKKMSEKYIAEFGDKFLKSYIRKDVRIQEMEEQFIPLLELESSSNALYDYINLMLECKILSANQEVMLRDIL